jgi:hypothetical protein
MHLPRAASPLEGSSWIPTLSLLQFSPSFFYIVSLEPCRWFATFSESCVETRAE